ncbi:glycine-rich protein [Williamsia herbipolensis]|uniref:receptor protein-tyrosine kinase n=1 Tax=Williamsia herbipolensis TaxID=1603258 RepID=A0AAU4K5R9_9NOCA|nr:glycine-rich protein [Williamsia herbipolensis]
MFSRRRLSMIAAGMAALAATIVTAPSASAAPLPRNCTQALFQSTVLCTWSYTGAQQVFVVPRGLRTVLVTAVGAGGADTRASGNYKTRALQISAYAPVVGGQRLYIYVGGNGQHNAPGSRFGAGGYNGGGRGIPNGGGGASDVRTVGGPALSPAGLNSRLVVAGGAGGSSTTRGGDGGRPGESNGLIAGGGAGSSARGGTPSGDASPGGLGVGGSASASTSGGGGGGGYFGGAGGFRAGGGGGGSAFPSDVPPTITPGGARVTIRYNGPCNVFCLGS